MSKYFMNCDAYNKCSGPYVEIEMRSGKSDGYDAIYLSPHKFLGGPGTPGILVMSKALYLLRSSPPSTCGGGTVDYVNGFNEKVCPSFKSLIGIFCLSNFSSVYVTRYLCA